MKVLCKKFKLKQKTKFMMSKKNLIFNYVFVSTKRFLEEAIDDLTVVLTQNAK